jgi:hypothetical protein
MGLSYEAMLAEVAEVIGDKSQSGRLIFAGNIVIH